MLQKRINHYLLSATFTLFSYSANATKPSYQNTLLEIDQKDYFPKKQSVICAQVNMLKRRFRPVTYRIGAGCGAVINEKPN